MSPVKEPCFFASEIRPENLVPEFPAPQFRLQSRPLPKLIRDGKPFDPYGWLPGSWEEYLRLFQDVREETVIGEASAAYLWSPTAAENIRQRIPEARIAMVLRDPSDRAFSQYLHLASVGMTRASFREHLEQSARGGFDKIGPLHPFLEVGLYHQQVKRFLDAFPRDHIRIYWYEEDWGQPARMLADLFGFLGVDDSFQPEMGHRDHERRAPRSLGVHYLLKKLKFWYPLRSLVPDSLRPGFKKLAFRNGATP